MAGRSRKQWRVVRDVYGAARVDVALLCERRHVGWRALLTRQPIETQSLFHRSFKPRTELGKLETYAGELERFAKFASEGAVGCFVRTREAEDGSVAIVLYERWFDGQRTKLSEVKRRTIDPSADEAVVHASEAKVLLEDEADQRNLERELDIAGAEPDDSAAGGPTQRLDSGEELVKLLDALPGR